jgi:hypothetical protein
VKSISFFFSFESLQLIISIKIHNKYPIGYINLSSNTLFVNHAKGFGNIIASVAMAKQILYNKLGRGCNMNKIRESSGIVKSRILDVAARLFAQHGVDSVSIRTIAAEAGINHSLVIRYFGSKDELVTAILRREISSLTGKYSVKPGQETSVGLKNLRSILLSTS